MTRYMIDSFPPKTPMEKERPRVKLLLTASRAMGGRADRWNSPGALL